MTDHTKDPLSRALTALDYLHTPDADAAAWQELQRTLLVAQAERAALMAVAEKARAIVDALSAYDEAMEEGRISQIEPLGEACAEVEDELVEALNHVHALQSGEAALSGEEAYLAALDSFSDDDEEPRH